MTRGTLAEDIESMLSSLLDMARDICWNTISQDCLFIISEIDDQYLVGYKTKRNSRQPLMSLDEAILELKRIYDNLYDINLYVFQSKRSKTIIEIKYYPKSSLEKGFYEQVKGNEPMLHCKIAIPPYLEDKSEKFDINWRLGGLRYEWNMFWWRRRMKRLVR